MSLIYHNGNNFPCSPKVWDEVENFSESKTKGLLMRFNKHIKSFTDVGANN